MEAIRCGKGPIPECRGQHYHFAICPITVGIHNLQTNSQQGPLQVRLVDLGHQGRKYGLGNRRWRLSRVDGAQYVVLAKRLYDALEFAGMKP